MKLSFRNPTMVAATVVLIISAVIVTSALIAGGRTPAATDSGCGMGDGTSKSGQTCPMMGGGMMGTMHGGDNCVTLSGKVASVDRDGTLTVRVKPAANTPEAARRSIGQLKAGDTVSMMMVLGKPGAAATPATTQKAAKYTCPMHPDVVSNKPGQCPKCGMNLVPAKGK